MSTSEDSTSTSSASNFARMSEIEFSACMKGYYNGLNGFYMRNRELAFQKLEYHRDFCVKDHEARLQACYRDCMQKGVYDRICKAECLPK